MPKLNLVLAGVLVLLLTAAGVLFVLASGNDAPDSAAPAGETPLTAPAESADGGEQPAPEIDPDDPLAYDPAKRGDFERRGAAGFAHPLFTDVPGGATETAQRVAQWRDDVEDAADEAGIDADTLEAMVYLESAGRADAIAAGDVEGAAGLTQILSGTGTSLLGMDIDLAQSKRLTKKIVRAEKRGQSGRAAALAEQRAQIDERFVPTKALAATAKYMRIAREELPDQEDLLVASYHMGIGNLQDALRLYGEQEIPYAQLFFDSSPLRNGAAYRKIAGLGDDSGSYWFRVLAAREIMRLSREEPAALRRVQRLQAAKASAENLLHPPARTTAFAKPDDLRDAREAEEILPLPRASAAGGFTVDKGLGELAKSLGEKAELYRAARPEALALMGYIGRTTREISGDNRPLKVTSAVRDQRYQDALVGKNVQATKGFSLHTTGFAIDVRREYASGKQARAFQFLIDRLRALNLLSYVVEPGAIHFTASNEAAALEPWLDELGLR